MRMPSAYRAAAAFAVLGAGVGAGAPHAQTYKADDIIRHFQPAAPAPAATRAMCVGTEADCSRAGQTVKTASVAAFDLVVRFKYNSDVLEPDAKINLDEFAKALRTPQLGAARFVVEGHTDAAGSASYNVDLSQRRADAVAQYLAGKGIAASRLLPRGLGQSRPVVGDPLAPENRRVETRLSSD